MILNAAGRMIAAAKGNLTVTVGKGAVGVTGNVGGTSVGVSVGRGDSVSVNVGGTSVNLGLGGLL